LVQTDFDGTITSYPVLRIRFSDHDQLFYPNPASEYFQIRNYSGENRVTMIDSRGNRISVHPDPTGKVYVHTLSSGVYQVIISFENEIHTSLLIKK
jgi:hypothetical protein